MCYLCAEKVSAARIWRGIKKKTDITAAAAWPKNSAAGGGDLVIQVSSFGVGQRQGPDRNAAEREKGSRSTDGQRVFFFFLSYPSPCTRTEQVRFGSGTSGGSSGGSSICSADLKKVETRRHGTKKSRAKRGTLHMHQIE